MLAIDGYPGKEQVNQIYIGEYLDTRLLLPCCVFKKTLIIKLQNDYLHWTSMYSNMASPFSGFKTYLEHASSRVQRLINYILG